MIKYVQLISSTNPIEIDQIRFSLSQEGIKTQVIGEEALMAANIELTGIAGADIKVPEEQLIEARKILVSLGYNFEHTEESGDPIRLAIKLLAIGFLLVILYMSYLLVF